MPEVKHILKRTCTIDERDYTLVQQVFPERGTLAYLPGLAFRRLADYCREHGIETYEDRSTDLVVASISGVVSNLRFARPQAERNDG